MYNWNVMVGHETDFRKDLKNSSSLKLETDITWELLSKALKNSQQYNVNLCKDCKYLNGKIYQGSYLVCGSHPYGCQDNNCADWEDKNQSI